MGEPISKALQVNSQSRGMSKLGISLIVFANASAYKLAVADPSSGSYMGRFS
jgi:hypothetical protein